MAEAPLVAVATNFTSLESNPRANRGLDFVSLVRNAWDWLSYPHPDPLKMYPEEAAEVLRYQARRDRTRMPHPLEGEASPARSCFFLRKYTDKQEFWSIDTDAQEITRLAFFAKWEGQDLHYDLEIGTPKP
jgi:hypothetical protein